MKRVVLFAALFSLACCTKTSIGLPDAGSEPWTTLSLLAGGLGGPGNIDGMGLDARFQQPASMTRDRGNLYIADSWNCTVRKLELSTGEVTTVAGTAQVCGTLDGIGTAAQLMYPEVIAADGLGNLYVTEVDQLRRIVIATGEVTTLGRRIGHWPDGMTVDGMGNLYEGSLFDCSISKMVLATGERTLLAGTSQELGSYGTCGSADGSVGIGQLEGPGGLALDGLGNLYIADGARKGPGMGPPNPGKSTIRKVELATGTISTIAGSSLGTADGVGAAAQFNAPTGLALDGSGILYVADSNVIIRKVVLATAEVTTVAGNNNATGLGAAARFSGITGLVTDQARNLYVGDSNSIRKVALATGEVSTVAGSPSQGGASDGVGAAVRFNLPTAVAADSDGSAYILDLYNGLIRKIDPLTGDTTTLSSFGLPGGCEPYCNNLIFDIANDGAGYLHLSYGGTVEIASGQYQADNVSRGWSVATDHAGHLYSAGLNFIQAIDLLTAEVTDITVGHSPDDLFQPSGLATGDASGIYVASNVSQTITRVAFSGDRTVVAGVTNLADSTDGIGAAARFNQPRAIVNDGQGSLYVADSHNSTIRKVELATGRVTTVVGRAGQAGVRPGSLPARLNNPTGLALLPNGQMLIVDSAENSILLVH